MVVLPWLEGTLVALERLEVPLGEVCYLPVLRRHTDILEYREMFEAPTQYQAKKEYHSTS